MTLFHRRRKRPEFRKLLDKLLETHEAKLTAPQGASPESNAELEKAFTEAAQAVNDAVRSVEDVFGIPH